MNVFILCTGRCGSTTFIRAASHVTNFTSGHETRARLLGADRVAYPPRHIEADHYLSWFLGKLDERYGDDAWYVHLTRDPDAVARSLGEVRDWLGSLPMAYRDGLLKATKAPFADACRDQVDTVNANIRHFLKDKSRRMDFKLERAAEDWPRFWAWIGAEGDYDAALAEWSVRHNATPSRTRALVRDARHKAQRVYRTLFPR